MRKLFTGLLLIFTSFAFAQQDSVVLTLGECIQIALESNIALQQAENNALIAKSAKTQAMMNVLPDLNAQWNYNLLFGTFWDNVAARQVTEQYSSNPNINSSFTLFSGLSQKNNIRSSQLSFEAAEHNIDAVALNTKTNVLTAYLAVVLDRENISISEKRLGLLEAQLDREIKRESVGVGNLETVYNFRSQVANERLSLTNLKNQLRSDMLTLVQLLRIDPSQKYTLEVETAHQSDLLSGAGQYSEILGQSMSASPAIRAAEASHQASIYTYKMARGSLSPTVSLYGELGSRYSSQGAANPENNFATEKASYMEQMDWNQYQFVGISVNLPIFSRFQRSNNIQQAKLTMFNAELDNLQAEQDVINAVQKVYLDLVSSQESYRTAQENLVALDQSFEFVKKRYETGNTDFYTYLESLNNKNRAEIELVNAQYSIIFRQRILEIYQSNQLH